MNKTSANVAIADGLLLAEEEEEEEEDGTSIVVATISDQ